MKVNAKKQIVLFAYSRQGIRTALQVAAIFHTDDVAIYAPERLVRDSQMDPENEAVAAIPEEEAFYGEQFARTDLIIFVSALGIAVRKIAPYVKDKTTDPAVVCLDELGTFVISVLSGHIGGANAFARRIAKALDAIPVITTATDVNHRFSVDTWATANQMVMDDLDAARAVSAAILGGSVPIECHLPVASDYPAGIVPVLPSELTGTGGKSSGPGILLSWEIKEPFEPTLRLIPQVLHLGIGCRKGISGEQIRELVDRMLEEHRIDRRAIKGVYTIDLKKTEAGLLAFCEENHWPLTVYAAEELRAMEGQFSSSAFVQSVTGVDNVCERAALKEANRLIVRKTAANGVTAAVALEFLYVDFDRI